MQQLALVKRISGFSKLAKFNMLLLITVMIAATMMVSFAATPNAAPECGAKVSLILDRSSSIGDPAYGGAPSNITGVRDGAKALVGALKGNNSYLDYYAFASWAQRSDEANPGPRKQLTPGNVSAIQSALGTLTFKTTDAAQQLQPKNLDRLSEGATNWEGALKRVADASTYFGNPTHIVMFTDGEPTTNQAKAQAAVNAGGSYANTPWPNDKHNISPEDLSAGIAAANAWRAKGVTVYVVATPGSKSPTYTSNLAALAGGSQNVFMASSFSNLTAKFQEVASKVCAPKNAVSAAAKTEDGKGIAITVKANAVKDSNNQSVPGSNTPVTTNADGTPKAVIDGFVAGGTWRTLVEATAPAGYTITKDACKNAYTNAPLTQVSGTETQNGRAHMTNLPEGTFVHCDFTLKKNDNPAPKSSIQIIKDVTPTTAKRGDTVTYSFAVKNTGETKLTNVKVKDPMLNPSGDGVIQTIGDLAIGETKNFTKPYVIPSNAGNTVHNVAVASGIPVDKDGKTLPEVEDDDDADVTITPNGTSSWTATKTADQKVVVPGDTVNYTITVTNTGNTDLVNIEVSDPTIGLTVQTIPLLKVGESKQIKASYKIPEDFKGNTFKNVAVVCLPKTGQDPECKYPEVIVDIARVEIVKTADPTTAKRGDTVTYKFVVKNTGNVKLTNVKVTDKMLNPTAPYVIETIGDLAVGASKEFTKTYKIPSDAPSTIHNVAIVTGTPEGTTKTVTDDDDADVTVQQDNTKSWTTKKVADKSVVVPGETVNYTISVTNTGNVDLVNVEVSDPKIGLEKTIIPLIKVGETKSVKASYKIPADYEGDTFKNVAVVCLPKVGENQECKNPEATVDIVRIEIVKSADKDQAGLGDKVKYTFVVTNRSKVTLYDVKVTDNILGELGTIDVLEPGESKTITVEYTTPTTPPDSGTIRNTATACGATEAGGEQRVCDSDDHDLIIVEGTVVTQPPATQPPKVGGNLAFTGSSSTWLATIAALIIAAGAGLVMYARKRKANHNLF